MTAARAPVLTPQTTAGALVRYSALPAATSLVPLDVAGFPDVRCRARKGHRLNCSATTRNADRSDSQPL